MYTDGNTQHKRRKEGEVGGKKRDKSIVNSSKFTGVTTGHARQSPSKAFLKVGCVCMDIYQCVRNYQVKHECG